MTRSASQPARTIAPRADDAGRRIAWVVCGSFGAGSETWIARQLRRFERYTPRVICWKVAPGADTSGIELTVLPGHEAPDTGPSRWIRRAAGLPSRNFLGCSPPERRRALEAGAIEPPDLILAHFGHNALRTLPIAEALGVPLICHFHGLDIGGAMRNRWYRWSIRAGVRRFAQVVYVGSHHRERLRALGVPEEKLHLIPCGVPTEEFTPNDPPPAPPVRVLAVSRLVGWKGLDIVIRAFAELRGSGVDAVLDICGAGPELDSLRALAQSLGVADRVSFKGLQPQDRVREAFARSHIFVQCPVERGGNLEGFGVSIAEAASCALPVVGTRCGGVVDQVVHGETGLLVDQGDVAQTAEALRTLATDPEMRSKLGAAGRARMVEHFDARDQASKVERVMDLAIGRAAQ